MEEVLVALKNNEKPAYKPVNEFNYPYRISNNKKCLQGNDGNYEKVVILYIIKSALCNQSKRDAIRKSWGWENRFSDVNIKRIFMLGVSSDLSLQDKIDEEYARNKDLVQADFIDSYYNNTLKTMMGFKWTVQNCPKAQFIMFVDDDMYVSTKNLLKFIRNPFNKRVGFRRKRDLSNSFLSNRKGNLYSKESVSETLRIDRNSNSRKLLEFDPVLSAFDGRLLAGYVFFSSPMRHKSSKWYISLTEYPFSKYPPYVTAGAYVVSYPALEDLYYTSMYTQHFKFDDVYLGIVAKKCGISPLHNEHFYFWREPYSKEGYSNVIASHGFDDPDELKKVWEEQRSLGHA
ncbi:Beta-1,3-galactosyltransferase brn [Araneus ventricosus]|uniref:Hexosyltransferase n=1 Tax=Araneus ventricosus TaxID=182803 RepID=A0A4Y2CPL0_ARAVE|nr:Beta-1,3-galactosyltransferase brn [Araneus ventricosus]